MTDPVRDKLWADVYTYRTNKGDIWFKAQEEADHAVHAYDKRPSMNATPVQIPKESP
jgi:hypothetical protein